MTDPVPDVELLADLDAGLLDPERAAAVRAAALADPRSAAVLDALAATRAELRSLPPPAVPPEFAAVWYAALNDPNPIEEPRAPVLALPARPRRRRVVLAAAALAAVLVGGLAAALTASSDPRVTLAVTGPGLGPVGLGAVGRLDFGPLSDDERRAACLSGLGLSGPGSSGDAVGGLPVRYRETPGVLLVLATGERGRFRIVVVDDGCSRILDDVTVG